jgi:hypothetical protein
VANPFYWGTPKSVPAAVSAANTNRDGTGTLVDLVTGAANGSPILGVAVRAAGTVTDGVIRLFYYNGTTNFLIEEILVTATTPSATVEVFSTTWEPSHPLTIASGHKLKASTHNAETFNLLVSYGER